jgi:hypothetical protein
MAYGGLYNMNIIDAGVLPCNNCGEKCLGGKKTCPKYRTYMRENEGYPSIRVFQGKIYTKE